MQPQNTEKPKQLLLQIEGYKHNGHGWQFFSCGVTFQKTQRNLWAVVDACPFIRKQVGLEPLACHRPGLFGHLATQVQETILANNWQHQWVVDRQPLLGTCNTFGRPFGIVQQRAHTTYGWPLPAYVPCNQVAWAAVKPTTFWARLLPTPKLALA